jgi:3-oxoacyl-[acyl-carrier protein] reductase
MTDRLLEGKTAIVTGSGRGIGRSVALTLARNGAAVCLAARTEAQLKEVQQEIEASGGIAAGFPTDVGLEADCVRLVRDVVDRFGRLDMLINNAGMGIYKMVVDTSQADWDRMMNVNARGAFFLCRESIPHLKQQPPAFIVNISSVVGLKGYANQAAYSASKHALMGMTKALAREVQANGIRVHAICPGGVDTDLAGQARPDLDRSVLIKPDELADIVLFLVTRRGNAMIDQIDVRRQVSTPWI